MTSLAFHQWGPGLNPRHRRLMWFESVVGSLLCSESFFFCVLWFLPLLKTNTSKFQFNLGRMDMFKRVSLRTPMSFVGKKFTIPLPPIKGAVWPIQYHSKTRVWEFHGFIGPMVTFDSQVPSLVGCMPHAQLTL